LPASFLGASGPEDYGFTNDWLWNREQIVVYEDLMAQAHHELAPDEV
jgi:hypothetical protein